ncbi:protein FAR1-RELATED SEQUENCE 5-like [Arachis hypogaea]|uniref:protein FAR1-RELATED SEQUENCE 5-like n=1 Tax=Arachis hypogaea TaxID=3818 RepID=UPI000DECF29F|nr:protein FAR1-RELATED SEQUENCE 5-like [Arachis hypogaea]
MISYLEGKANADMTTVLRYTRTADNRLGSLFWVDGEMMSDYQLFGDVLAFDSTYRSNKYKKPLVVFSGSNHHKQTTILGFALLEDEEVRSYKWLLLNLVDVMGEKTPCIVVTDADKVMRTAIAEVFAAARHRLCGWHLEKNCVQMVKDTKFRKVFKKAIYVNFEVENFEEYWKMAVESLGLQNNSWVQSTYEVKESWATAYLQGTFCAGYRTTSRCEGINPYIKGFLKSTDSILELVHSLDCIVKDYRNNKVTVQFYSTYYSPVLTTGLDSIELFASKLYTRAVFREVKKQIKGVATLLFRGRDSISTTVLYKFSRMGTPGRIHKVLFDPDDKKIQCDCAMWNSEGIPCSHIFCMMKYEGLEQILESLIMRRWCKDAKDCRRMPVTMRPGHDGRMLRYAALCSATSFVVRLASEEGEDFEFARESIASLIERLCHKVYERAGSQPGSGVSPTFGNGSHHEPAASSASHPTEIGGAYEDQRSPHGEAGLNNVSSSAVNTSSMTNWRGSPCWRAPFCGGGSGGNFFLGGQHIYQFYASQPCSGQQSEPPPQDVMRSMSTPTRTTNEDLFEGWLLQDTGWCYKSFTASKAADLLAETRYRIPK